MVILMVDDGKWMRGFKPMMLVLLFVSLLAGLSSPGSSVRAAEVSTLSRQCVAAQLEAVSADPSSYALPPDRSRRYHDFFAETFHNVAHENMDPVQSWRICQDLGAIFPNLKEFWPSRKGLFRYRFEESLEPFRDLIVEAIEIGTLHTRDRLGAETAFTINVLVGASFSELRSAGKNLHLPVRSWELLREAWETSCQQQGLWSAIADAMTIIICLPGGAGAYDFDVMETRFGLADLMADAYYWTFSLQAMGLFPVWHTDSVHNPENPEPPWLHLVSEHHASLTLGSPIEDLQERAQEALDGQNGLRWTCQFMNNTGNIAPQHEQSVWEVISVISDLEDRAGRKSFTRLYTDLGFTLDWRVSFQNVYGDTPEKVFGCGATQ